MHFAGPFEGSMWFIVVDAHTKWPEVIAMNTTAANNTITVATMIAFARYGILNQIASDNGSQFTSEEYRQFCESNGIRRTLVAPYHPSSMGKHKGSCKHLSQLFEEPSLRILSRHWPSFCCITVQPRMERPENPQLRSCLAGVFEQDLTYCILNQNRQNLRNQRRNRFQSRN